MNTDITVNFSRQQLALVALTYGTLENKFLTSSLSKKIN